MLEINNLTQGERLLLDRRRRGVSQSNAVEGVDRKTYRKWETDESHEDVPEITIHEIYPHEQLLLIRRRTGLNQTEMAERLGISLSWQKTLESGGVTHSTTILKVLENLNVVATGL